MLQIGITGGIGSGKTTVCKLFEGMGVPVFNADLEARAILDHDTFIKEAIRREFGKELYNSKGKLNRKAMAAIVFNNQVLLEKLNNLVHPAVGKKYEAWVEKHRDQPYVIKEAAILFESGSYKQLDKIVVVSAAEKERIRRVVQRDGITEREVRERMSRQLSEDERIERADYVIRNDGEQDLLPQVKELHKIFTGS